VLSPTKADENPLAFRSHCQPCCHADAERSEAEVSAVVFRRHANEPRNRIWNAAKIANCFKSTGVANIVDFTILVSCGAVRNPRLRRRRAMVLLNAGISAGAKALPHFQRFAARLKSCPGYKTLHGRVFPQPV
jgi:hypothetical protein